MINYLNKSDNVPRNFVDGPADIFNTFFASIVIIIAAILHELTCTEMLINNDNVFGLFIRPKIWRQKKIN